jgi:hypothetical protein
VSAEEKQLDGAPGRSPALEAGCSHPGGVTDQEISSFEEIGQLPENGIDRRVSDYEEARGITRFDRYLRDGARRQLVIEFLDAHGGRVERSR